MRLAASAPGRDDGEVLRKPVLVREDVDAILAVLFDIHRELIRIRNAVKEDGDEEEEN